MAFELFFGTLGATEDLSVAAFQQHFAGRPHTKVQGKEAHYNNDATGVQFAFRVHVPPEIPIRKFVGYAQFSLDFVRPGFFATEATREIGAFVAATGYEVYDAQRLEHPPGPWDPREFIASWDASNRALLRGTGSAPLSLPKSDLLLIWRWNFARPNYAAQLGGGHYVPPIMLVEDRDAVRTAVVWNGEMRAALPKVDLVLTPSQRSARRGLLRRKQEEEVMSVAEWRQVAPFVASEPVRREPGAHYVINFETPPAGLLRMVEGLPPSDHLRPLTMDEVIDHEVCAA
ncbi:MAG: hypothetical protein ACKVVT_08370 [Dehalococcoidia bacterium]